MLKGEAQNTPEPQKNLRMNSIKYIILVLFLLFAVILLGINSFYMYINFNASKEKYVDSFERVNSVLDEKARLTVLVDGLTTDNATLKEANTQLNEQNKLIMEQLKEFQTKYNEINRKFAQIEEDNIALQNSLKIAASAGIKPQNYSSFKEVNSRGALDREAYLGKFLGTAYTPSKGECGNNNGITNSGEPIIPGVSIAVDSTYWPFGTIFYIKGLGYAVAMDTGSAIKGRNRFDFAVFDKNFAMNLGERYWDVYIIKLGTGKVDDINF